MKVFRINDSVMKLLALAVAGGAASSAGAAEWHHGIGTGMFGLNIKGDEGFGTQVFGPINAEVDLSSSDISDVAQSAAGLAGFSTNGTWSIFYGGSQLALEDTASGVSRTGVPVAAAVNFEATNAEFVVGYQFAPESRSRWGLLGGFNYVRHDYEVGLSAGQLTTTRVIDNDWTDVLVGVTYALAFSDSVSWANRVDAGFGGSEGSYHARTGINWRSGKSWMLSFFVDYKAIEFEDGSEGDADWYLYDAAEFGPGFGFAYIF